ncbi:MAG: cation-translocating P-type ATPase [Clostridia bacterium]
MNEYYFEETGEVLKKLNSTKDGLSSKEAEKRLNENGHNKLKETKKRGIILKFIDQFKDVMLIVLIIAAILSAIVSIQTGEPLTDTIIILIVVVLNAILGVVQESKAEKAIDALKCMSLPYIKVRREGNIISIKTEDLVIGDIVVLEAGDTVPADMRIIKNHSLRVEESALTGESVPVDKIDKIISNDKKIPLAERLNMIYSGSSVVYGRAEALVTAIGMDTELGKIAEAISTQTVELTPLQKKINELSKVLSIIILVIAVVMFVVGYMKGNPVLDVFMLAISLAVAAIPEGLSAVITITLAIGVQKMASKKAIVRKLSSVEALGATEVICSDKTGTLTQNKMTLRKILVDGKLINVDGINSLEECLKLDNINKQDLDMLLNVCTLCNDTTPSSNSSELLGDPTETALVVFASKMGKDKIQIEETNKRIEEIPFDSVRKMMTTVNKFDDGCFVLTKGAIESVLNSCTTILIDGEIKAFTKLEKEKVLSKNLDMANSALRVLAMAYKKTDEKNIDKSEDSLTFVGLIGMIDPPRLEAKAAVSDCFKAGMIPVMITGDNKETAVAIAKELGIIKEEKQAITGIELDEMSDEELFDRVENIRVYARVSPENKIRIVKAWKKHGRTVAMTGDGVNDAPALKGADIGIGMGITGTEVSKSVSSMVLADDNFATIVVAIKEGRKIYNNIQNVIAYLLASNLAEVLIIFIATLFNKTLLFPIQILWINLITDTIPAIALGFEKAEKNIMKQKPRKANESLFSPLLISRITSAGIIKAIAIFIVYAVVSSKYGPETGCGAVFLSLSLIEVLFAMVCRSDKKSIFEIGLMSNKHMLFCFLGALLLQFIIVIVPIFSTWLRIPTMEFSTHLLIIGVSFLTMVLLEIVKVVLAKTFYKQK